MTQVSNVVDVLWNRYLEHPEKLSKVDWEYLTWKNPNPLSRSSLIDGMHKYIKPVNNKYEEQWRKAHKKILKKVGKLVASADTVSGQDLIDAIDAGIDINIIKYMISKCDNIDWCDKNSQGVLHHCAMNYIDLELLNALLNAGANSAMQDCVGDEARDLLDHELWGDDYGKARMMLRPGWTHFYCD